MIWDKIVEKKVLIGVVALVIAGLVAVVGILNGGNNKSDDDNVSDSEYVTENDTSSTEIEGGTEIEASTEIVADTEVIPDTQVDNGEQTESNVPETPSSSEVVEISKQQILEDYLQNTVKMQMAMMNSRTVYFNNDWHDENRSKADRGIAGCQILDLDNDGEEELVVVYSDAKDYYMSVYEVETGVVVKKAEKRIGEVGYFVSDGTDDISIVETATTKYILYTYHLWGVVSDGYNAAINMWKYDGVNILPVMDIVQTCGGSSDFEFTAYHYDTSGSKEEVAIYREFEEEGKPIILDRDGSLMASQFARYGIAVYAENAMFSELENIVQNTMNRKVLYREVRQGETEDGIQVTMTYTRTRE